MTDQSQPNPPPAADPASAPPVLEAEGVTKRFPGVLANDSVNLTLRRGEILALLGENGAGKSTLMNIIYGLYHQDEGTVRLKGREVHFSSPREAIHSGIGMVHQHFQLVDVMTVAENVVLGEEETVAYDGKRRDRTQPALAFVLQWMPSIVVFVLSVVIGLALSTTTTAVGGVVIGAALAALVAIPAAARLLWGVAWRVGLALVAVWIAAQIQLVTEVGLTAVALRSTVETVDEERPQELESGVTVKVAVVERARIDFNWSRQYRDATEAGLGIEEVMDEARAQLEEHRDDGVPGWLIDASENAPPIAGALGLVLVLILLGWHGIASWRGLATAPHTLSVYDLAAMVGLVAFYTALAALTLDDVSTVLHVVLTALVLLLGGIVWLTYRERSRPDAAPGAVAPLDGTIDALLMTLDNLTEIRNVSLAARRVRDLSQQYGLEVDPDAVVEKLPVGAQQRVEIVKALYRQADILILDEPTAVLTPQEGRELFKIMRELAAQGVSIIFITHKLKEVFEVATNIVVMRGGRVVGTTTPAEATETSLAAMMVGREVILQVEKGPAQPAEPVLEVRNLQATDDRGARALDALSFDVRAGEVLGIAGVQGNGQTELVEVLTGLRHADSGSVRLLGTEMQPDTQPEATLGARGLALALDTVIVALLAYILGALVGYFGESTFEGASTGTQVLAGIIVVGVVDVLYFLGGWRTTGSTLGMTLVDLQVVDRRDHAPRGLALVWRYLLFLALRVPLYLPLIASLWMARGATPPRTWFDRQLGLRVIRREQITPRRIKDTGTSHVPEDRLRHGLVKLYSVSDNLVLNDYYERPYAQAPNLAELPLVLLGYAALVIGIVAALTVGALAVWDAWLWEAVLDTYNVPDAFREIGDRVGGDQRDALQYPFLISAVALLAAELLFGIVAHLVAVHVLGADRVSALFASANRALKRGVWRVSGQPGDPPETRGGLLRDGAAIQRHAAHLIDEFDIRTPSTDTDGGNLSGGNQQKLIVAREFSRKPRLLIAAQPTRGIDVGSIEFIHRRIIEQRDDGAAVLLVSAELDEIMALADRIAVLYKGQIIDTLPAGAATREQLGLLMAGIKNGGGPGEAEPVPEAAL